jgi:hypothetical protein
LWVIIAVDNYLRLAAEFLWASPVAARSPSMAEAGSGRGTASSLHAAEHLAFKLYKR